MINTDFARGQQRYNTDRTSGRAKSVWSEEQLRADWAPGNLEKVKPDRGVFQAHLALKGESGKAHERGLTRIEYH